jgi:hypothetical protein
LLHHATHYDFPFHCFYPIDQIDDYPVYQGWKHYRVASGFQHDHCAGRRDDYPIRFHVVMPVQ